jgi:ribose transport system permease protein
MIGAIYVLVALVVIFSFMKPSEFFAVGTAQLIVNQYATTGLVGLALLLPLASGLYDLSVGSVAGLSGIAAAWMLANVTTNPIVAVLVGLAVAVAVGLVNALVVLVLNIDSFIGTLATGSIVAAIATAVSGDTTIAHNVNGAFQQDVALTSLGGITLPAFITLGVAILLFVLLERTAFGRRSYAIGFDTEVARLGGVRVKGVRTVSLVISAVLAGLAGVLATAVIGAGDPATGPSFLLPAFAVAFLGATQFRAGRFNAWGTVVAVLLLGTGNVGLLIVGGPSWSPDIFDGAMLIAAVGLTSVRGVGGFSLDKLLRRRSPQSSPGPSGTGPAPVEAGPGPESVPSSGAADDAQGRAVTASMASPDRGASLGVPSRPGTGS